MLLFLVILLFLISPHSPSFAADLLSQEGPLPTRDYHPFRVLFLAFPTERALPLPPGQFYLTIESAESNTVLEESTPSLEAVIKTEILRFSFNVNYGVTRDIEIGIEIPFLYRFGGFLDPFIISVEDAVSRLNPRRIRFTTGAFEFAVKKDGQTILLGGKDDVGLADISVRGKMVVLRESERLPALSLRMGVKIPTGSRRRVFGSGDPDFGIGLALQKEIGQRWVFYINQNVVFPGGGDFLSSGIDLRNFYSSTLAVETRVTPRFSLIIQIDNYTSPFEGTGTKIFDKGTTDLAFGFHYRIGEKTVWRLFGVEDVITSNTSAADFTLFSNVTFQF